MPALGLYLRLSGFYFAYFAILGALVPYWSLYLRDAGLSQARIGELMAILLATKIVAPNVWGWMADHTGQRMRIIRLASLAALVAFSAVYLAGGYWSLALVMAVFSFFWNAALPQFEATTMNHLGDRTHRYSNIRLWGSIGFILSVAALGPALDRYGTELLPAVIVTLFGAMLVTSLLVPESAAGHLPLDNEPLHRVLRRPVVVSLLVVCFLVQASHGAYYAFYTLYLEDHGYTRNLIGQLWALGVVAEIAIFLAMHRLMPRFGPRRLLLSALALTALRWLLIAGFVDHLPVLVFAQTLHAASFGVYHAVAIHLIHRFFTGPHQGRGQALYSSLSFGAGGAVGTLMSGYLMSGLGPTWTYGIAAGIAVAAFGVAFAGLRLTTPAPVADSVAS